MISLKWLKFSSVSKHRSSYNFKERYNWYIFCQDTKLMYSSSFLDRRSTFVSSCQISSSIQLNFSSSIYLKYPVTVEYKHEYSKAPRQVPKYHSVEFMYVLTFFGSLLYMKLHKWHSVQYLMVKYKVIFVTFISLNHW